MSDERYARIGISHRVVIPGDFPEIREDDNFKKDAIRCLKAHYLE